MPITATRRMYEDQIPSFMSILDPLAETYEDSRGLVTMVDAGLEIGAQRAKEKQPQQQHLHPSASDGLHRHVDGTSTHNSESAESSPTTTLTTDTSSLSDPSPSSSPDSPVNLIPLGSFPATTFGGLSSNMTTLSVTEANGRLGGGPGLGFSSGLSSNGPLTRPMTSPSPRRARNMKGLSIQPPGGGASANLTSEPSSPSFIKPKIPLMKRKPSQLSLKTSTNDLRIGGDVPASPGVFPPILQRRSLKHSTSSPHMLSGLKSAMFGPAGGMTLPTLTDRGNSGLSEVLRPSRHFDEGASKRVSVVMEEDSPIRTQMANRDFEPIVDESEANEDLKSPSYPNGPIAIYEENVYLYLEPTAEEAAKFDVVINVAQEVTNPFVRKNSSAEATQSADLDRVPDTAMTTDSFATAFEFPTGDRTDTSDTPKAENFHAPEYIHMPWEHNTDISVDLMNLCEMIEKRTRENKKVLIHCQQGASRSASLIIAYGLYQNPGMSVNDAYYRAQSKSRWISPNMRLMYCLQDFQKEIAKRRMPRSSGGTRNNRSPTKHRLTLSADAIEINSKEPPSAPLPEENQGSNLDHGPDQSRVLPRNKSLCNVEAVSPGPSSAPSSFSWFKNKHEDAADPGRFGKFDRSQVTNPPQYLAPHSDDQPAFPPAISSFYEPPAIPGTVPTSQSSEMPVSPGLFSPKQDFRSPPTPGFAPSRVGADPGAFGFSSIGSTGFLSMGDSGFSGVGNMGFGSLNSTPKSGTEDDGAAPVEQEITITRALPDHDALMSPRVETMTNNPLHDSLGELAGMKFSESSPPTSGGIFSPRETMFPRDPFRPFGRPPQVIDPRSPPTKGETPIVRSIDGLM